MQRALVIMTVLILVTAALAVGSLASNWPFWRRAWQWQMTDAGWPEQMPGPAQELRAGDQALPLQLATDSELAAVARQATTHILLLATADGKVSAHFAAGFDLASQIDGRGLTTGLLAPLFGRLAVAHTGLFDRRAEQVIKAWQGQRRGAITPRQLLWQMSGMPAGVFRPLNPFSARSQLAAGPDFERAALRWRPTYPAGSHFEESPFNAQLLAVLAARLGDADFAQVLETQLWSQFAGEHATALLDRRRGNIAAHCCLRATAADWLRLGLLLADSGKVGSRQVLPEGFMDELTADSPVHVGYGLGYGLVAVSGVGSVLSLQTTGRHLLVAPQLRRALLWVGEGEPPALVPLLSAEAASTPDSSLPD